MKILARGLRENENAQIVPNCPELPLFSLETAEPCSMN
jgi:hypothetical protein